VLFLLDGFWKRKLLQGPILQYWIVDVLEWIVLPLALVLMLRRAARVSPADYGLRAPHGARDILILIPLPLITLFLVFWVGAALGSILFPGYLSEAFRYQSPLASLGKLWIVGTFYLAATAALWESIFLLGLPWLWFSQGGATRQRAAAFALLSAAVFALGHWENGPEVVCGTFLFQLLAAGWYFRYRTLWPVIGAHFLIDLQAFWPPAG
jgi:membrane protease YdiL (CAAX protease family)